MALSPYITPQNLNGVLQSSSKVGEILYRTDEYDALDKRNHSYIGTDDGRYSVATGGIYNAASQAISSIKDINDTIENAFGARAPMYKIGDISGLDELDTSNWVPSPVKGLVRAVVNTFGEPKQDGVIIDGIGDADGSISVSFTKNPVIFRGNEVIDNRFREPMSLRMTVMVSNYLNDDITGTLTDSIAGLDPTGIIGEAKNLLAYGGNTRAQHALYRLRWLAENAKCFNVYTPHGVYENMLIKSLKPQTNSNTMDMLYCDIEFQEMIMYAPYSGGVGKMPARKGIDSVREGWTNSAVKKVKTFFSKK